MEIGPLATQRLLLVEPAHSLVDVARRMQGRNVGAALVQAGDGPGIITERDVLRAVSEGVDLTATTVGDYMTSAPVVAAASCDIMQAAR
ncbi:MAG TPA: CBS domain-containing protein, partial [Actinomycetota bacterium]|nr:CBS domain-containing protein [Actinomycetota bacterium]